MDTQIASAPASIARVASLAETDMIKVLTGPHRGPHRVIYTYPVNAKNNIAMTLSYKLRGHWVSMKIQFNGDLSDVLID